jgi:hypothetical protein
MGSPCGGSWLPMAAYLYTLRLDPLSLAWEYLRRNSDYQDQYYRAMTMDPGGTPEQWCLERWEDPREDSRALEPLWHRSRNDLILVRERANSAAPVFNFWAIPGRKTLQLASDGITVVARSGPRASRIRLTGDLTDGDPFSISIEAGRGVGARARAAREFLLGPVNSGPSVDNHHPALRSAVLHMQRLQALDGEAAGASHRQIAEAVFGHITNKEWINSASRARVRYLLKSAHAHCEYGYRNMLGAHKGPARAQRMTRTEQSSLKNQARDSAVAAFDRKDLIDAES